MPEENSRIGGDITASDMLLPPSIPSEIQHFFANSTVFITGATGFLGQVLLEKLLRSCPEIKRIYVLVRPKKGKSDQERFSEILDSIIFDGLKRNHPGFSKKVLMIRGDCALPSLGLDEPGKRILLEEVNCVFHFAATVRFDQSLKTATHINVRATKYFVELAHQMKELKAFVYCSTAYSFCPRKEIDEKFYQPKVSGDGLLQLVELVDDETLEGITNTIISPWPNTYSFTKAAAENIIEKYGIGLPITIISPAIVISTYREPLAGWVGTIFGFWSLSIAISLGILRIVHCDVSMNCEIVPADFVINLAIAVAWRVGTDKTLNKNTETDPVTSWAKWDIPIYNYVCSTQNHITWKKYTIYGWNNVAKVLPLKMVRYPACSIVSNKHLANIGDFIYHRVPAYVVDYILSCLGRTPMAVKLYNKYAKVSSSVSYFLLHNWKFTDGNRKTLWMSMNASDRDVFHFDLEALNWDYMLEIAFKGGRVYLLKDPLETLPQARRKEKILKTASWLITVTFVCCSFLFFFYLIF